MTSENAAKIESKLDLDEAIETRDITKWVWICVIGLFVAMGVVLYTYSDMHPQISTVRASHILVKFNASDPTERAQALTRIRDLRERVLKGEDFEKLAREYSNDPLSASKGGDLGYVRKGDLTTLIDTYIWTAPVGQLSDIIQSPFGFHIVVVTDIRLSEVDALNKQQQRESGEETPTAP